MEKWTKPELFIEKYELSQDVASGCSDKTEITVTPGGTITFNGFCANYSNNNGHAVTVVAYDANGNGKIDNSEWQDAYRNSTIHNGNGYGHLTEHGGLETEGGTVIGPGAFTS